MMKKQTEMEQELTPDNWHYPLIIAIDPDVEYNGLALLYNNLTAQGERRHTLELHSLRFPKLWKLLHEKSYFDIDFSSYRWADEILLCVEAGWLHSAHWHTNQSDNIRTAARKGNSVGRNHEVGRKLVELLEFDGRAVELVRPLPKIWRGKGGKISHDEFATLTQFRSKVKTNQEERDAGLIAWSFKDVPRPRKK